MSNQAGKVPDKRILVICPFPYDVAAGQRLKYEQYFSDWRSIGFHIDISPYMDEKMWGVVYKRGAYLEKILGVFRGHGRRLLDLFRIRRYDIVYVFMWVTPLGTTIFERLVRCLSRRMIYDIEDNVLLGQEIPDADHSNAIIRFLKSPAKMRYLIGKADCVITSSPFLNETCLKISENKNCFYISSSVDTDRFIPVYRYTNDRKVTIGWTGTFSSKPYIDLLRDVFKALAKRVQFKLKIIGNFDWNDIEGVELEVVQWDKSKEVADLQDIDIGVYPLPMDEWVNGKSGLKAIQYMAFGLPVVASAVGTTPLLITTSENGLLVRTTEEWLDALERLVKDPQLRQRLGSAARNSAVDNYSTSVISKQYRKVLEKCMGHKND